MTIEQPQIKCVVCRREVEPPKKVVKATKPPAPVVCGYQCARDYNGVALVRSVCYGSN